MASHHSYLTGVWSEHHPTMQMINQAIDDATAKLSSCDCASVLTKQGEEIAKLMTSVQELTVQANHHKETRTIVKLGAPLLGISMFCIILLAIVGFGHTIQLDEFVLVHAQIIDLANQIGALRSASNAPKPSNMPPSNDINHNSRGSNKFAKIIRGVIRDIEDTIVKVDRQCVALYVEDAKQSIDKSLHSNELLWKGIEAQALRVAKLVTQEMLKNVDGKTTSVLLDPVAKATMNTEIGEKLIRHFFTPYPVSIQVEIVDDKYILFAQWLV